ncbi:MAG: XRE family transcriptional regulator [Bacteroidales bacterium]|jgi:transcriptional regulator with XRE-family HTH domain|nr:XRE family transcriptional regulator [Bacteroidales bacterium]
MESNKIIGSKIKSIREVSNLTVDEVSERSGVSVEQIERIEKNVEIPSLAPLIKIARVFGVRIGTFLDDQTQLGPVISRGKDIENKKTIRFADSMAVANTNMEYHSLSQDKAGRHMEPFLIEISPASTPDFDLSSHEGEEFIYVLDGAVEISYGKQNYILEAGDSIYYDSVVAHHVHAKEGTSAKILGIVYTPF